MRGSETANGRTNGRTVNVWKIGRRTSFDFPTRSAPPSHSFALPRTVNSSICAYFFFLPLLFSLFFFFRAGENRLSGNAKEETPFETMLFYRRTGSITLRPDIVYPWPAIDRIFGIVGLNEFFTRFMRRGDNGRLEFFCKLFNFPPWFYQYSF